MRKLFLLVGVAALAASMPAFAGEKGRGQGGGGGHSHHAQGKGGGHGNAQRARGRQHQARGQVRGGERRAERRVDRGGERRINRAEQRAERAIQQDRRQIREARRDNRHENRADVREARREDRRDWRGFAERRLAQRDRWRGGVVRNAALGGDCPPGLARQNRFCMPPGQLRTARLIGQRLPFAGLAYNVPELYRARFADNDRWFYRSDDSGYVYRFDRRSSLVSAVYPLFGNDLMIGEPLPLGYEVYNVPLAYRGYYPDNDDYYYRYDDGAIYRVGRENNLVDGVVALLTGGVGGLGGLGVGDPLPAGYDVYNVPMSYRDRYYDSDQSWYRYADGAVYQVDPQTRLIEAVVSLLT